LIWAGPRCRRRVTFRLGGGIWGFGIHADGRIFIPAGDLHRGGEPVHQTLREAPVQNLQQDHHRSHASPHLLPPGDAPCPDRGTDPHSSFHFIFSISIFPFFFYFSVNVVTLLQKCVVYFFVLFYVYLIAYKHNLLNNLYKSFTSQLNKCMG
jgi:hypothetical protein